MFDNISYNIPASMIGNYRGRRIIVRSPDPEEIVEGLAMEDLDKVSYVQVLTIRAELHPLMLWGDSVPVDLIVQNPEVDLPFLYECSQLLVRHPVRITVPLVPGFGKVVKLAASLNFALSLDILQQPDGELIDEMCGVAHAYLHQPMVSQPIEYFHSMFFAFHRHEPLTLWDIQEEDPSRFRFITDDGKESTSRRFAGSEFEDISLFEQEMKERLLAAGGECSRCEFIQNCSGYFKWPHKEYRCDGVKAVFQMLRDAAHQLQRDLEAFHSMHGGERS